MKLKPRLLTSKVVKTIYFDQNPAFNLVDSFTFIRWDFARSAYNHKKIYRVWYKNLKGNLTYVYI